MTEAYAVGTFTSNGGTPFVGIVRASKVLPLASILSEAPQDLGAIFKDWTSWGSRIDAAVAQSSGHSWLDEADLEAQLPYRPTNLLGAGANYRKHVIELIVDKGAGGLAHLSVEERRTFATKMMDDRAATGKPFVWVGLPSAVAGPAKLILPYDITEPDWELELGVVIGKPARRVSRENALDYVAGYTIANDVTARELVERPDVSAMGMDWLACKSAPGFHILGPYITPAQFVADPQKLQIRLSLNGKVMQDEGTDDMIFDVATLIEFTSKYIQLYPGDVIMTGSPSGNGTHYNRFLQDGDVMTAEIEGLIGQQVTRCEIEQA